eukprot:CAMPEP_0169268826 /NCGR_PEP_ID=MMETSP1016-20121227/48062_1 /TAXON_ID=342587 /ORGANISM="Karlodinium micrum, Strain CCMP2283" /LENGTH=37 /DNA_ID= /DNA_START= /DNA_END= /DNA_ORIENTATION=
MAYARAVIACLSYSVTGVASMKCPSSPAFVHAGVQVT